MKSVLFVLLLLTNSAFAREVNHQVLITKGPYLVPVINSVFNALDSDFKSEGIAVVYMTDSKINVEFPRVSLFTLKATQDKNDSNYYYSTSNKDPKVRVGFEGEKLSWFFSRASEWNVSITREAQIKLVAPLTFAEMDESQLAEFAERAFLETEGGSLENVKVESRRGAIITAIADVMQMGENDDDPVKAGEAVITFNDIEGARTIKVQAQIEDRE